LLFAEEEKCYNNTENADMYLVYDETNYVSARAERRGALSKLQASRSKNFRAIRPGLGIVIV